MNTVKNKKAVNTLLFVVCFVFIALIIGIVCNRFSNNNFQYKEKTYQEQIDKNTSITVKYESFMDEDYYEYFLSHVNYISPESIPEGYNKYARLNISLNNNSAFSLSGFILNLQDENFYITPECINIEPTHNIAPNSSIDVDMLIYINDRLKSPEEVKEALNKTDLSFLFYIENEDEPLKPYKVNITAN